MRQAIDAALKRLEAADDVRVLYAVESGSRAWGFASRDSDWDVRFIYLRRPDWYLSIQRRRYFSSLSCMHHYFHMAEGNYREYLQGDPVRVKKYFYVLRPVLACRWIAAHGTMPPTEFASLVDDQLPDELRAIVHGLLERKRSGDELAAGPRVPEINEFLDGEVTRLRQALAAIPRGPAPDWEALDGFFRECLAEVWGEQRTGR